MRDFPLRKLVNSQRRRLCTGVGIIGEPRAYRHALQRRTAVHGSVVRTVEKAVLTRALGRRAVHDIDGALCACGCVRTRAGARERGFHLLAFSSPRFSLATVIPVCACMRARVWVRVELSFSASRASSRRAVNTARRLKERAPVIVKLSLLDTG